jgi:chromosome segregation ATPase
MLNIVNDLRLLESGARWVDTAAADTLEQAADEIERLRAKVVQADRYIESLAAECYTLQSMNERLQAERNVERANAETLDAICRRTEAERDEAVATLALYRMKNGCTRGQRTTQWCDAAEKALAERDRLREALEHARRAMTRCEPWDRKQHAEAFDVVCAALKETGHE